mgnify:CR=1 FL=1
MSKQKRKIDFTVACVNEFAHKYDLPIKEAFQYLFRYEGIAFIKENYDVEHTLDFETILEDLGIVCRNNGGTL